MQAAILSGDKSENLADILLLDVTSHSLGIEIADGTMTALFKRNTTIPKRETSKFTERALWGKERGLIRVYEGEKKLTRENNLLGEFYLKGIRNASIEDRQIKVTFDIDVNGILNVSAEDMSTGNENKITITNDKGKLLVLEEWQSVANLMFFLNMLNQKFNMLK